MLLAAPATRWLGPARNVTADSSAIEQLLNSIPCAPSRDHSGFQRECVDTEATKQPLSDVAANDQWMPVLAVKPDGTQWCLPQKPSAHPGCGGCLWGSVRDTGELIFLCVLRWPLKQ